MRTHNSSRMLALAVAMALGVPAMADMVNWSGTSGINWDEGQNWAGTAPTASDVAAFDLASYTNKLPNLNVSGSVLGLSFTGAGSLSLSASSGFSLTLGDSGISMQSGAGATTISAPLVLGSPQTWSNDSTSPLTISGVVDNNSNTLTVGGGGNISLAAIQGNGGLIKSGTGTVTLTGNSNRTSGSVTLSGGRLVLNATAALGNPGILLYLTTNSTVQLATDQSVNAYPVSFNNFAGTNAVTILSDRATPGAGVTHTLGNLTMYSRTLTLDKGTNVTSGTAGITFGTANLNGDSTLITNAGVNTTFASFLTPSAKNITVGGEGNTTVTGTVLLSGGTLTKTGGGQLTLSGTIGSAFSTVLMSGVLQANDGVNFPSNSLLTFKGGVLQGNGNVSFTRAIGTSGTNVKWDNGAAGGGFSAYGGTLTVTIANSPNTEVAWGAGSSYIYGPLKFGSATANAPTVLTNKIDLKGSTRTIDVTAGAGGDFATISNVIRDSTNTTAVGLNKNGGGTLRLAGASTYTGTTSVNAGTLLVDGSLASGSVLVSGGATLGGIGTISNNAEIQSAATLNPGSISGLGTLTLGTLTLDDGSKVHFDINSSTDYDKLILGSLVGTGDHTLEITLTGLTPLNPGDRFQIFSQGIPAGTFTSFVLPGGYAWSTDSLGTTGDISIQTSSVPEPGPLWLGFAGLAPLVALWWRRRRRAA